MSLILIYCVQEVTEETAEARDSHTFYCYDTEVEAFEKHDEMIAVVNSLLATTDRDADGTSSILAGHWAVYANVGIVVLLQIYIHVVLYLMHLSTHSALGRILLLT
jgi:hypothetical protein